MIIILLIIGLYLIFGVILDMFQVYYCIKKLNEKESLNFIHILFWPVESIISLVQLIKRLSNKYIDLMIDAYGNENLIEDKKSKKKDEWTITATEDFVDESKSNIIGVRLRLSETSKESIPDLKKLTNSIQYVYKLRLIFDSFFGEPQKWYIDIDHIEYQFKYHGLPVYDFIFKEKYARYCNWFINSDHESIMFSIDTNSRYTYSNFPQYSHFTLVNVLHDKESDGLYTSRE